MAAAVDFCGCWLLRPSTAGDPAAIEAHSFGADPAAHARGDGRRTPTGWIAGAIESRAASDAERPAGAAALRSRRAASLARKATTRNTIDHF
jgi:hypothetical protein